MAYVYILECADGRRYTGLSGELLQRLRQHHRGRVRSTKGRLPVRLVYFEECLTLQAARQREKSLKNGRTRKETLDHLIAGFPPEKLRPFA